MLTPCLHHQSISLPFCFFLFLFKQELYSFCLCIVFSLKTMHIQSTACLPAHQHRMPDIDLWLVKHLSPIKLYQINSLGHSQTKWACLAFVFVLFFHRQEFQSLQVDCCLSVAYCRFNKTLLTPLEWPQQD